MSGLETWVRRAALAGCALLGLLSLLVIVLCWDNLASLWRR
jgi:hypothetical protein